MNRSLMRICAAFLVSLVVTAAVEGGQRYLRDSFVIAGADGQFYGDDVNDRYFFEVDANISDGWATLEAGEKIELLPSAGLEKLIADANSQAADSYRLWGRVTRYKDRNFVFPIYFLAVTEVEVNKETTPIARPRRAINESGDALALPEDIVKKLQKKRKVVRVEQLREGFELKADSILADRAGFLVEDANGKFSFVLDGIGRNLGKIRFKLLPCQMLFRTEHKQVGSLNRVRFRVAGIVTRYKGENYLLLQRATRTYNHGNFGD